MGLARINDGLKLRVGQQAVGDDISRKVRPIGGIGGATDAIAADWTSLVGCG